MTDEWQYRCYIMGFLRRRLICRYLTDKRLTIFCIRFGENIDLWGLTGLLHDFDYEKHPSPEEHPMVGIGILTEKRCPEETL